MRLGIQVFLFLLTVSPSLKQLHCSESSLGGSAILAQPIGARQIGMGETFVAVADDLNTVYYNPSGLAQIDKEMSMSYLQGLVNTYYASFGFGKKLKNSGSFGLSMDIFQAGSIDVPVTDTEYKTLRIQDDYMLTLTYAIGNPENKFSYGINLKFLQSTLLEEYKAVAYAADFGILLHPEIVKGLSFGAAIQNAGSEMKYESIGDPMPLTYRFGFAYHPPGKLSKLLFAADLVKLQDSQTGINSGMEFFATNNLTFRAGYRSAESINYYSIGLGFYLNGTKFDYSQTFATEFQSLYQTTLSFGPRSAWLFGKETKPEPVMAEQKEAPKETLQAPATTQISVDQGLTAPVEKQLQPIFSLIKEGYYFKAYDELDILLLVNQGKESWKKVLDKLDLVVKITHELTKQSPEVDIAKKGLVSFLKPVENPKDALIRLRYAWEISKDENDRETIKQLYYMLQNYYPEIAKLEQVPEGLTLVNHKLFKALNDIYDGHYDVAIEESQEVLNLEPDNILAMKRLGSAFYCLGTAENKPEMIEKGREIWKKVLNLSPDDKEIKEFLQQNK